MPHHCDEDEDELLFLLFMLPKVHSMICEKVIKRKKFYSTHVGCLESSFHSNGCQYLPWYEVLTVLILLILSKIFYLFLFLLEFFRDSFVTIRDSLLSTVTKYIRIGIGDKNDNPPYFDQAEYEAEVNEDEDIQHTVITVTAKDKDECKCHIFHLFSESSLLEPFFMERSICSRTDQSSVNYPIHFN